MAVDGASTEAPAAPVVRKGALVLSLPVQEGRENGFQLAQEQFMEIISLTPVAGEEEEEEETRGEGGERRGGEGKRRRSEAYTASPSLEEVAHPHQRATSKSRMRGKAGNNAGREEVPAALERMLSLKVNGKAGTGTAATVLMGL